MGKRAALYVRVSTQEQKQHGLSIDNQIASLRQFCKDNGFNESGLYNDAGISAHISYKKRPGMLKLIDDCQKGLIDVILVTKLDRFFRSVPDYYAVMEQINGIPWRAIQEDYETETSSGIFKVNIMLSVAQAEAERTSDRVRAIREYQKANGYFVGGKTPIGYKKVNKRLEIDEDVRPIVDEMFDSFIQTTNIMDFVRKMRIYDPKFSRKQAHWFLRNQIYRGNYRGYPIPAYLTPEKAARIDEILDTFHFQKQDTKRTYIFTTILKCPTCGSNCCGVPHQSRWKTKDGAMHKKIVKCYVCVSSKNETGCTNGRLWFERSVENSILNMLDADLESAAISAKYAKADNVDNSAEIERLETKLKRIGVRFEDGDISIEEYRDKRADIKAEISALKDAELKNVGELPTLPDNWREIYNDLDDEHKRQFWRSILKRIIANDTVKGKYILEFLYT